ncbi:MAG: hypothetical protein IT350_05080 [Deltaproteobacteria bacterium]|nr:hypothetical protein [Deltaproteobacteria bacterium]
MQHATMQHAKMKHALRSGLLACAFALAVGLAAASYAYAQSDDGESSLPTGSSSTQVEVEKLSPEEMKQFEERLEAVRDRVLKSKASLKQLLDQLRMGSVSLISFSILHTHEVGATFQLETMTYMLDGYEIYTAVSSDDNDLENLKAAPVYDGSLLPGEHLLTVDMVYRGKGYGLFSYLSQYLFKVKARYVFTVQEGDVVTLKVTSYDQGAFLTSLRDRLQVRFEKE